MIRLLCSGGTKVSFKREHSVSDTKNRHGVNSTW